MTDVLSLRYENQCATPSDIHEHLPVFVDTVLDLNATKVIELGTRTGVSTIAWLYALEQTGGHLWSVDIDEQPEIGTYPHWTFLQGDDQDPTIVGQLPNDADIVFIDTSHEYMHTLRELNIYRWFVRPGGRILLHDTELAHPLGTMGPAYPVKRAVAEFCDTEGLTWENRDNCYGLGIVQL